MFASGRTAADGWTRDGLPGDRFLYGNVISRYVHVARLFPVCAAQLRAVISGQSIENWPDGRAELKELMDNAFGPGEELQQMRCYTGGELTNALVLSPCGTEEEGNLAARVRQADGTSEEIAAAEAIEQAYYSWRQLVVDRQPNLPDISVAEEWWAERTRFHRAYALASMSLAISDLDAYDAYVARMTAALVAFVAAMDLPEFFFREQ